MKLELTNKKTELEESTNEKQKLNMEVESLREELERAVAARPEVTSNTQSLSDEEKINLAENSKLILGINKFVF